MKPSLEHNWMMFTWGFPERQGPKKATKWRIGAEPVRQFAGSYNPPCFCRGMEREKEVEGGKFWIWLLKPVSRRTWEVKMDELYLKILAWCFACFLNCNLTVPEWNYSETQLWTSSQSEYRIEYAALCLLLQETGRKLSWLYSINTVIFNNVLLTGTLCYF